MSTTTSTAKDVHSASMDKDIFSSERKKEYLPDVASILSGTTVSPSDTGFPFVQSLYIHTIGMPSLGCGSPPSELKINVYNSDGSLAYVSTRHKRSSGNCTLSDGQGRQLISTTYFFGPGRDPVMRIFDAGEQKGGAYGGADGQEMKTSSRWISRSHTFILPDGRTFTWEYKKGEGFGDDGKKGTALVMMLEGKRVAALIRNKNTRTPGSKKSSAANGGQLALGEDVGTSVAEDLVVASCLLMLKKEVDRMRQAQIAAVI